MRNEDPTIDLNIDEYIRLKKIEQKYKELCGKLARKYRLTQKLKKFLGFG